MMTWVQAMELASQKLTSPRTERDTERAEAAVRYARELRQALEGKNLAEVDRMMNDGK